MYERAVVVVGRRRARYHLRVRGGGGCELGPRRRPWTRKGVNNKLEAINNSLVLLNHPRHFNLYHLSRLSNFGRVVILNNYEAYRTFLLAALDMRSYTTVFEGT